MAAAAAPTSMPQALPSSAMECTQVICMRLAAHSSSRGSVTAGSASSARKTCWAVPPRTAFFSCLAPTTIRLEPKSGASPQFGMIQSFFVTIQVVLYALFRKCQQKYLENFCYYAKKFDFSKGEPSCCSPENRWFSLEYRTILNDPASISIVIWRVQMTSTPP